MEVTDILQEAEFARNYSTEYSEIQKLGDLGRRILVSTNFYYLGYSDIALPSTLACMKVRMQARKRVKFLKFHVKRREVSQICHFFVQWPRQGNIDPCAQFHVKRLTRRPRGHFILETNHQPR